MNSKLSQALDCHRFKYVYLFIATSVLIDVIASLIFFYSPFGADTRNYFLKEDSLIENLTAGLLFCTFLFASILLICRRKSKLFRKWLTLLSTISFIGFLDEISFGERLFDLEMPRLNDMKIDALHDFFGVGLSLMYKLEFDQQLLILFLLFLVIVLSIIVILKYGYKHGVTSIADVNIPLYLIMSMFMALVLFSLILDAKLINFRYVNFVEEMLELNASLALLISCFYIRKLGS